MAIPRAVLQPHSAIGRTWDLGEDGVVTLKDAGLTVADAAESLWRSRGERRLVDWSWRKIVLQSHETLAFTDPTGGPVALWASAPERLLVLPNDGLCYRLDFLEIDPALRGGVVGYYAVAVACDRALEAGADNLVLAALPDSRRFWEETIGATVGRIHGWHVPGTLLPCRVDRAIMEDLRRDANACQSPANGSSSP